MCIRDRHSPRDRKSLQHAARKSSYRSVSDVCQFNLREQSRGVRLVDAVEAGEEAQVLLTVQISVEKTVVTDNTDAASEVPVRRKRASKNADAACLRANEPGHGPEERGLAGAVRPEQHDRLATAHVEIDAAQNPNGPETPLEAADLDCCRLLPHNCLLYTSDAADE